MMGIFQPQAWHLPRSHSHEKKGTLCRHSMFLLQDGQWLGLETISRFSALSWGSLCISTFANDPNTMPKGAKKYTRAKGEKSAVDITTKDT
jgi:hypothetical protein